MAIKDLVRPELPPPTPAAERPPNITCEKYTRGDDGKRCIHFQQGGTCALPDEFVCTEWQKHNGPNRRSLPVVAPAPVVEKAPAPKPVARDLFGNPLPEIAMPPPAPKASMSAPSGLAPKPDAVAQPTIDVDQLRGFTTEDIERRGRRSGPFARRAEFGKFDPSEHGGSSGSDLARAASQIWCRTYTTPVVLDRPNRGNCERAIASHPTDRRRVGSVRVLRIHARVLRMQIEVLLMRPSACFGDGRTGGVDTQSLEDLAGHRAAGDERSHLAPAAAGRRKARAGASLRASLEALRIVAEELRPFLPTTASALAARLNAPAQGARGEQAWNALAAGAHLGRGGPLFPRADISESFGQANAGAEQT
jgi:hypothetical protein